MKQLRLTPTDMDCSVLQFTGSHTYVLGLLLVLVLVLVERRRLSTARLGSMKLKMRHIRSSRPIQTSAPRGCKSSRKGVVGTGVDVAEREVSWWCSLVK